jgi:hypothetical protein
MQSWGIIDPIAMGLILLSVEFQPRFPTIPEQRTITQRIFRKLMRN